MTWPVAMLLGAATAGAAVIAVLWGAEDKGMVRIPAGPAILGADNPMGLAGPQPYDVARFQIDRFEVTNAQYRAFVAATGHRAAEFHDDPEFSQDDQPVTGVRWADAKAFCSWAGKRLPTEVEWEKAARGESGRAYPWGAQAQGANANVGSQAPMPVQAFAADNSPYDVRGMAGNVSEWVSDTRLAQAGVCGPPHNHGDQDDATRKYLAELATIYGTDALDLCRNPEIPEELSPVEPCAFIKGNNWSGRPHMTVSSNRMWDYADAYADFVGFRCARNDP